MFNNMKNQVREKTGREIPKFTPQKGGLSRQSRQGSESSLSSLVVDSPNPQTLLSTPTTDQHQLKLPDGRFMTGKEVIALVKKEEELRSKLEKKDNEWTKKLEKRELELMEEWNGKKLDWEKKEHFLTEDLLKQTTELKEALCCIEEYKRKICHYQEDKDQLEGFQIQEMAKVKHLLLAKEKENNDISTSLKENLSLLETLKVEVARLRPFEEQISNFQDDIEILRHTSEKERWQLSSKLAQSEEQVRHLTDRVAVLTRRNESDVGLNIAPDERVQALLGERALLERRLEEAHVHLTDIKASWSAQISSLETQVGRLSRQAGEEGSERRKAEAKIIELEGRLEEEGKEREKLSGKVERLSTERDSLAAEIKELMTTNDSSRNESTDLKCQLEVVQISLYESQKELERLQTEVKKLHNEAEEGKRSINLLEEEFSEEKKRGKELNEELDREKREKDEILLRNAQFSQEVDIKRQELRQLSADLEEVYKRNASLEGLITDKEQETNKYKSEVVELLGKVKSLQVETERKEADELEKSRLRETLADLETQLADRNKNIKILQQRLSDMKKTLQRELKTNIEPSGSIGVESIPSNYHNQAPMGQVNLARNNIEDDVNFLYLKHVIIKFLTSREYEAQHLTKAVATLLKLSPEEEGLLKETLEWRMSWFGSRPKLLNNHHQSNS